MTRRLWMAVLLTLCACATSSQSGGTAASTSLAEAEGDILIEADGRFTNASIQGNTLKGMQLDVNLEQGTARGTAHGEPVELTLQGGQVVGKVGAGETRLQLEPRSGGVSAEGMVSGQRSSFKISSNMLSGTVAACSYDLQRSNRASAAGTVGVGGSGVGIDYKGARRCADAGESKVTVTLPSGFDRLAPAQQATILSLVLMRPAAPGTGAPKP